MDLELSSISDTKNNFLILAEQLQKVEAVNSNDNDSLDKLIATMLQFFEILDGVDKQPLTFVTNDITDIAEHGLSVLEKLIYFVEENKLLKEKQSLLQISLVIADWAIERDGNINILEPIVDALAQLANNLTDTEQLISLAEFMGKIAAASSDQIKQDVDISNTFRPWRILNVNRAIVAARTNDPTTMRQVFADLIKALPLDAPSFFKEGISEMVRLNYPDKVCDVMQEYFEQTDMPKMH